MEVSDRPGPVDKERAGLYRSVFDSPEGRKVLEDLIKVSQFYGETWDPHCCTASYKAGKRRLVGRIINFVSRGERVDEARDYYKGVDNG